jgi:hypothetical protein
MNNIYQVDTLIQLNVTFLDAIAGTPVDPTTVSLFIEDPLGNETQPVTGIVRTGVGVYYYQFTPSGPGKWTYKWQGTGAVIATSPDTAFVVRASALIN